MENNSSSNAVTQQYRPSLESAESQRSERQANQSKKLADVTAAFRTALANEAAAEIPSEPKSDGLSAYERYRQSLTDDDYAEDPAEDYLILEADDDRADHSRRALTDSLAAGESGMADDVDDLTSYMENFLQRMKCTPGSAPPEKAKPVEHAPVVMPPPKEVPQYAGPKAAPECKNALAQMRELANATARSSISHHASQVGNRSGKLLAISAGCCLGSIVLACLATATLSYTFIAAVVLLGGSAASCWGFLTGLKKLSPVESLSKPVGGMEKPERPSQTANKA